MGWMEGRTRIPCVQTNQNFFNQGMLKSSSYYVLYADFEDPDLKLTDFTKPFAEANFVLTKEGQVVQSVSELKQLFGQDEVG
jgi:hypothetical protein